MIRIFIFLATGWSLRGKAAKFWFENIFRNLFASKRGSYIPSFSIDNNDEICYLISIFYLV